MKLPYYALLLALIICAGGVDTAMARGHYGVLSKVLRARSSKDSFCIKKRFLRDDNTNPKDENAEDRDVDASESTSQEERGGCMSASQYDLSVVQQIKNEKEPGADDLYNIMKNKEWMEAVFKKMKEKNIEPQTVYILLQAHTNMNTIFEEFAMTYGKWWLSPR